MVGNLAGAVFWSCASVLVYVYWGYGALLALIIKVRGERPGRVGYDENDWPYVTVLLTVHNEKDSVEGRLKNLLEQSYASDRLEILVASDGSTDGTDEIVRAIKADGRVRLTRTARLGKSAAQNVAIREARGAKRCGSRDIKEWNPEGFAGPRIVADLTVERGHDADIPPVECVGMAVAKPSVSPRSKAGVG